MLLYAGGAGIAYINTCILCYIYVGHWGWKTATKNGISRKYSRYLPTMYSGGQLIGNADDETKNFSPNLERMHQLSNTSSYIIIYFVKPN